MKRSHIVATLLSTAVLTSLPAHAAQPRSVTVRENHNGKIVSVHVGQRIRLVLHSTYWTIDKAHGGALSTSGTQTTKGAGSPCKPAGSGCGTATRMFLATHTGTGSLTASRTTCGEALRCNGTQGQYRVSIRVVR